MAEFYRGHSTSDVFEMWYGKLESLRLKLYDFFSEISEMTAKRADGKTEANHILQELVNKKMRFEEVKRRLAGD